MRAAPAGCRGLGWFLLYQRHSFVASCDVWHLNAIDVNSQRPDQIRFGQTIPGARAPHAHTHDTEGGLQRRAKLNTRISGNAISGKAVLFPVVAGILL
jgi:hypothetical protein